MNHPTDRTSDEVPVSTIDPARAETDAWDAVVIGAGLAGSITARGLAASGHRVLLVERTAFPRPKVCGCCLGALAHTTLDSIGLGALLAECGARPLEEVRLHAGRRPAHVPLRGVVGLSRERLDQRLALEAVRAGAELLLDTRAEGRSDGSVTLTRGTSTHELTARTVILAAGLRAHGKATDSGRRRTLVGVGAVVDPPSGADGPGVVDMVIDRAGYVGVAPLEDGRLTIASALRSDAIRRAAGPRELVRDILATAGLENLVGTETRMTGVPALHRHRVSVQDGRLLAIGDAAGFVEPITGEGMSWALATGAGVVPSADAIIRRGPDAARWDLDYRRMMRTRHLRCSLVGVGIRHPRLVRSALLVSNLAPALRAPVLSGLVGRFDPAPEGAPA